MGSMSISNVPAKSAESVTVTVEGVLVESISMWTKLPSVPLIGSAGFKVRLPRVSVEPESGEIVPEFTKTSPDNVPLPLNVPLWLLIPRSLQTEIDGEPMKPETAKFALLIVMLP